MKHSHRVYDAFKRLADVVFAAVLLILLSPVLALVAIMVRMKLGRPVIFRQARPGKDGVLFEILKFRTMSEAPEGGAVAAVGSDAERLTPFGRRLRSLSIDELPELVNILRGEMSFIGPRPLLPEYLERYNEHQARRHEVRPGLTGYAQVRGRNAVTWKERLDMDVYYVDHRSVALDLRILGGTVKTVLSREGVSAEGEATMAPFQGTGSDETDAS